MVHLKYVCKAPIQNGVLKHLWVLTLNNGYRSYFILVIKNYSSCKFAFSRIRTFNYSTIL